MRRNITIITVAVLILAFCLSVMFVRIALARHQNHFQPAGICPEFLVIDQNGHYLLNRSLATTEDADAINLCLRQVGINNVHIAKNFSDLMPSGASS